MGQRPVMPRKPLDIRFSDYPLSKGKEGIASFPCLWRGRVWAEVRTERAGMLASKTSIYPAVRAKMVDLQRQIAQVQNVVMDGRDIGTAVLPQAPLKIFLTASPETRARRRYLELQAKGVEESLADIEADIRRRDEQDTRRKVSPLRQAEDAIYLDSSDMSVEEVVEKILSLCDKGQTEEEWK